jgi:hypothetical protein
MKRCRLKRYNFQITKAMSKENKTSNKQEHGNDFIADVSESSTDDELYIEYMLEQMPELTEEEHKQKMKELNECADFIRNKGITPNLDSIY